MTNAEKMDKVGLKVQELLEALDGAYLEMDAISCQMSDEEIQEYKEDTGWDARRPEGIISAMSEDHMMRVRHWTEEK